MHPLIYALVAAGCFALSAASRFALSPHARLAMSLPALVGSIWALWKLGAQTGWLAAVGTLVAGGLVYNGIHAAFSRGAHDWDAIQTRDHRGQ